MKTLHHLLLVSGITLILCACRHTPAPPPPSATGQIPATIGTGTNASGIPTFRLTGKVLDAAGNPVAGAVGECYHYSGGYGPGYLELGQRFTANSNGGFECSPRLITTFVLVRKAGLAPGWKEWNPTRDEDITLVLMPPSVLAGVVVDETDKPVGDAEVSVAMAFSITETEGGGRTYNQLVGSPAQKCFTTRTTADGRFRIEGFPTNATADLTVKSPGKVLREPQREWAGPDSMQCRAGQEDIKLVVEPAGAIEGRVVCEDPGQSFRPVRLMLQPDRPRLSRGYDPVQADTNGTFRFSDVAAGSYRIRATFGTNATPDWVAEVVPVSVEAGRAARDVQVKAIHGGLLQVVVLGKNDGKPVAQAIVSTSKETYQMGTAADTNGTALLRLPPGEYQVSAYKENSRSEPAMAGVVVGLTNRVKIELSSPPKITGIVRDPAGAPVAGLELSIIPTYGRPAGDVKTDANGRYELAWNPQQFGRQDMTFRLLARDIARNLVAAHEMDEGTTNLDLQLQPGLVVTGRIQDSEGKPLSNGSVRLTMWSGNNGWQLGEPIKADAQGRFEIIALAPDQHYSFWGSAKGYGSGNQDLPAGELETNRVELDPFVLQVADRQLAGEVLDADEKPVVGAWVHMYGQGQPSGSVRTDNHGRFAFDQVCEGQIQVSANAQSSYGSARAEAGDTNVLVRLGVNEPSGREAPARASLSGKPLPDLTAVNLSLDVVPAGKPVLLCLFDIEQRPSRRWLRLLNEQQGALQQKGIVVLGVQAAITTDEAFKEWNDTSPVSFPVGRLTGKTDKTKWVSEVESLPWLILADADHRVTAEGFALDELEAKLKDLAK